MPSLTSRLAATILLAGATSLGGCAMIGLGPAAKGPSVEHLTWCLVGDFDNAASRGANESETQSAVEVRVRKVPAIPDAVYFEAGSLDAPNRPFRQRVFVVKHVDGDYVLEAWTLARPLEWAGATHDAKRLKLLIPSQIKRAEGCDVHLEWDGERYSGVSTGNDCEETSSGASHMTTEMTIGADGFTSLERGYAPNGKQVWGPIGEPYVFERTE